MPALRRRSFSAIPLAALAVLLAVAPAAAAPQVPEAQQSSGVILHRMQKLGVVGSVLYLAAHPDDENTRLIAYLSNGEKVRTGYLSLTRGDGGQNLIGPELGPGLGVIRTQELLEARRIDGGEQFFTRAVDFGYSKSPEEALSKWGKQEVLSDVVRVVRTFRPDVIVTRFDVDGSGGHGHHTASARLAREAFALAADPESFPEQIAEGLQPWQTKRLFFNASTWWSRDVRQRALDDPEHWLALDVGGYNALLGMSYNEIAGRARSAHRSQGFGSALRRGAQDEYLRFDLGQPMLTPNLFDGIDLSWGRIEGGAAIGQAIEELIASYRADDPAASFGQLVALRTQLATAFVAVDPDGADAAWIGRTIDAVHGLLQQVTGTVIEVGATSGSVAQGETLEMYLSAIQRQAGEFFQVVNVSSSTGVTSEIGESIPWNEELRKELKLVTDESTPIDQPYWLTNAPGTLYNPTGTGHLGIEPMSRSGSVYRTLLRVPSAETNLDVDRELAYTWVERVEGQRTRRARVTPIASIEPVDSVVVVSGNTVTIAVEVEALRDDLSGTLRVGLPMGWAMSNMPSDVEGMKRGDRKRFELDLTRTDAAVEGTISFSFEGPQGSTDKTMHVIDYTHIVPQTWYSTASVRVVPLSAEVNVASIGYIKGAGDDVPSALRRIGLTVEMVDPERVTATDLERFDSVVVGIRAYNAVPAMARVQPLLMDFVQAGGTMVVQYNTASRDMVVDPQTIGPVPFALTRGRVTVEESPATFLLPEHPLLNVPNKLTDADFDGWVQERGLYFAAELDDAYSAPIAWNDPGESPLNGALIACDFGEGRFIYTGISLFRQLPAGVPGAYRLLANLVARRSAR